MSAEPREPMGMRHVTVVPTNYATADVEPTDDDDERMDVPSDPRVPRHR